MDEATQRVLTEDSEITSQNVHSAARTIPGPILCEKKKSLGTQGQKHTARLMGHLQYNLCPRSLNPFCWQLLCTV